jgi:hypothetical protein
VLTAAVEGEGVVGGVGVAVNALRVFDGDLLWLLEVVVVVAIVVSALSGCAAG